MISVQSAKQSVSKRVPTPKKTIVNLGNALGCVLASDVLAQVDLPNFNNSAMDGYGMRYSDILNGVIQFKLVSEVKAGDSFLEEVTDSLACPIYTGAMVPTGVDVIIPVEQTIENNGFVEILDNQISQHQHIRFQGEQVRIGNVALKKGHLLNPSSIGFLAALGISEIEVFAKPSVAIITTGNELVEVDEKLKLGQIYNSNSYSLQALLKSSAIDTFKAFNAVDEYDDCYNIFKNALQNFDIIISTGGVSVGKYDLVNDVLESLGVDKQFHKVNQKPGKPIYFGSKGTKLVFGLPGNPAAVITSYYQYVLPAIRKWYGNPQPFLAVEKAMLTHDLKVKGKRTKFLKASVNKLGVSILEGQGSHILQSLAKANCFVELNPEQVDLKKGVEVIIHRLPHE